MMHFQSPSFCNTRFLVCAIAWLGLCLPEPLVAQDARGQEPLARLAASAEAPKMEAVRQAAFEKRRIAFLKALPASQRETVESLLQKHQRLSRLLLFSIRPEDKPKGAASLLNKMAESRTEALEHFPTLVAAIVLVHDEPMERHVVENKAASPDPMQLLDYYIRHRKRLVMDPKRLPPGLCIWMVDTTASIDQMQWALKRYAGHRLVGKTYFDLAYDSRHFYRGIPKKVTQAGYTLANLKRYGGVCADQAYYAMTVGKAIGVPTAMAKGQRSQIFHAWVGFLQAGGNRAAWNFSEGRYRSYRNMRGVVLHPQTRKNVPDAQVALSASLYSLEDERRWDAVALTDALRQLIDSKQIEVERKLTLFDRILERNPFYTEAWFAIADLARSGQLNLDQKKQIAKKLMRHTGNRYPDFTMRVLKPMIASVELVDEQEKLWAAAYRLFAPRKELAAEVLMARAAMWQKQGQTATAGRLYEDVIKRYANAGPFVIEALKKTEQQLVQLGKAKAVPLLYKQTLERTRTPGKFAPQFRKLSNWYRVAVLYKKKLQAAGLDNEAEALQARIDKVVGR